MSKIKVMSSDLANKIAAGEVVEKTMNVVKELVENSIDAEALEITIKLIDSGVKEIEVTDDGVGMDEEDVILAFKRHATSKLKELDDLFYIESLGFRGEALPSIASVSNVKIKTSNQKVGTLLTLIDGKEEVKRADLQKGTTITVSNLFYNTPVRLKYLKNLYVELSYIVEYINKMALAHPHIKFTLINNEKVLLQTDGKNDLLKVIYQIYGVDIAKKMIPVSFENDDYKITGYISYPEINKGTRNSITTLVNGRVIKNNDLNRCIIDCYHTYMHKGRYPVVILNIDTDPSLIDVNIHPTKMDIKFSKIDKLKELIEQAITKKLNEVTLIPEVSVRDNETVREVRQNIILEEKEDKKELKKEDVVKYEEVKLDFEVAEEVKELEELPKKEKIKKMISRGVVLLTYIVAENEDGMYLIDQHAAAERINYEKILKQIKEENEIIDLLVPLKIEIRLDEKLIIEKQYELLKSYGIEIDDFGDNTILVRTHPSWIPKEKSAELIRVIIDLIIEEKKFDLDKFIWRMCATIACRMSVMANTYISLEEQQWILDNLRKCDNPFTCPHGRPTIITYTKQELEHLFKRILD